MKRITAFILLLAFLGLLLLNLACGGGGYEGKDPKNEPAKSAAGVSKEQTTEPPAPVPEGATQTAPPEEPIEGGE